MTKLIRRDCDYKFFRWFGSTTKAKDINDFIRQTGNVNTFADEQTLQTLIHDKLAMKLWLIQNGFWK